MSKNIGPFLRYNRAWFDLNQESLLRLLNGRFTRGIARMLMRIRPYDVPLSEPICQITPNSFSYGLRPVGDRWQITTDFRTHPKYAKRVYFAMRPFLALAHAFDMRIANPFRPAWNLGFDTLTVYPDAHTESATVDGDVGGSYLDTWAEAISTGNYHTDSDTTYYASTGMLSGKYYCFRGITLFDTSSLSGTVDSATYSLYYYGKFDTESTYMADFYVVTVNPSSNTDIVNSDYDKFGSTNLASALCDLTSIGAGYNNYTISTLSAINIDGITKLGTRPVNTIDGYYNANAADNIPTAKSEFQAFSADETGTTKDPKLVVTYTVAAGGIPKHMDYYRRMRLK